MAAISRAEAGHVWLERLLLVLAGGFGVFLLLGHVVLPLLHIADVVGVDVRVPVMLEQAPGGAVEGARGEGVHVVRDTHAELVLDGADFGQRVAYRLPEVVGAAIVVVILWLLWSLMHVVRTVPFASKAVIRRLMSVAVLLAVLGMQASLLADWRMKVLSEGLDVTVYPVLESPLPYLLAAFAFLCVILAASRNGTALGFGDRSAPEEHGHSARLSTSEPELAPEPPGADPDAPYRAGGSGMPG